MESVHFYRKKGKKLQRNVVQTYSPVTRAESYSCTLRILISYRKGNDLGKETLIAYSFGSLVAVSSGFNFI